MRSPDITSAKGITTIRKAMRELRRVIDNDPDPAVQRVAYAMETAIRWATEKTVNWPEPAQEAKLLARMLRQDLKLPIDINCDPDLP